MDGFEVCRRLKGDETTRMIPIIVITALGDVASKVEAIEAGSDDFLCKPPNQVELVARIGSLVRVKRLNHNLTSIENVLYSLANAIEAKDAYTQGHVERVSSLALSIGRKMALNERELEALKIGGILHDIGKIAVPRDILNKPGALDEDEWKVMQAHTEVGFNICLPLKHNLGAALAVIRHHHERLDGSGYPDRLRAEEIPLVARIMAVVDYYDALKTNRPYRKRMRNAQAIQILREEVRKGKLDGSVVECLIDIIQKGFEARCVIPNAVAMPWSQEQTVGAGRSE
jgi:putative two-component system response regulator